MFKSILISLTDGQSFRNASICEQADFEKYSIPKLFGDLTSCFYADKKCILLHNWNFKLIQINRDFINPKICHCTERLVLEGNITFAPARVIDPSELSNYGIPLYFDNTNDRGGQCTFTTRDGTFITHATNIASMIIDNNRNIGITKKAIFNKQSEKIVRQPKIYRS